MTEPLYELAFYGRLVDGVSLETAKNNVTRLFKATTAQVDKMFGGGRVVIRNKLDKATADKYVAAMRKNGLVCEADIMGQKEAEPKPSAPRSKPSAPAQQSSSDQGSTPTKGAETVSPAIAHSADELTVLPLSSGVSESGDHSESHSVGINLAGEGVDNILQKSHLNLDPEGVRLSEHHEVEAPVFSEIDSLSIAPTGSDLVDPVEEIPPIVPDVSSISIAPAGSDMGQIKKDEKIEIPDLSHLKLDDLPDNQ
ncbi:hypothetical protein [Alkalimarinus alittae]|uniref:Uncharacterized protein n=1 Tax=Alkalimarinus alittae TaxID=2961619 RepID=A0ABY6N397_9ALTE|nr:hypothetical protein [Alkalimarinus alittae]UZE96472.1 hypothetical protein NKI27_01615 [Alkalimarinus alittae]